MTTVAVETPAHSSARRWLPWVALAAVLLLGAGLRAYHLRAESVWYDEYLSAGYLDRPNLTSCLREQRVENWEMVPLYYTIEYYWARCVGGSIPGVRWLSILFGLGAAALAYVLGRRLYGHTAGLVAALLVALSPFHIFHAQGIRPYSMMEFLALLSAYALFRATHKGGYRWWAVNVAANALLLWTHLFGVLLLVPEGCFLLVFHWRRFRGLVAWGVIHALLLVPIVLWVTTVKQAPPAPVQPPAWTQIVQDLFQDDAVYVHWAIGAFSTTPEAAASPALDQAISRQTQFEGALVTGYGIGIALAFLWTLRQIHARARARARNRDLDPSRNRNPLVDGGNSKGAQEGGNDYDNVGKNEHEHDDDYEHDYEHEHDLEKLGFLLMLWGLPVIALWALSWMWQPCFQERYTIYGSVALYILAGAAIAGLPGRALKALAAATLVALLGWQTAIAVMLPMRTNYRGAADLIASAAAPQDAIIVYTLFHKRIFAFNYGPTPLPLGNAQDVNDLCEQTDALMAQGRGVWVVVVKAPESADVLGTLERYLDLRKVQWAQRMFPGMQSLYVYQCVRDPEYKASTDPESIAALQAAARQAPNDGFLRRRLARILSDAQRWDEAADQYRLMIEANPGDIELQAKLGQILDAKGDTESAIAEYRKVAAVDPARGGLLIGIALFRTGHVDEGVLELRKAIDLKPENKWLWMNMATMLQQAGRQDDALKVWREAVQRCPSEGELRVHLGSALEQAGQVDEAIASYREATRLSPNDAAGYGRLGIALQKQGKIQEAVEPLRSAIRLNASDFTARYTLIGALRDLKDYDGAWQEVNACRSIGMPVPPEILSRLEQESGRQAPH